MHRHPPPAPPYVTAIACAPLTLATVVRCERCGWTRCREWARAEIRASAAPGAALELELVLRAREWLGDARVEHHREAYRGLCRRVAEAVLAGLALGEAPRTYLPGFTVWHAPTALEVGLAALFAGPAVATVAVRREDDPVAAMRGCAVRFGDGVLAGAEREVAGLFAWRQLA